MSNPRRSAALAAGLILLAWVWSIHVRSIWIDHARAQPGYTYQDVPLPTTTDSYLFGAILQKAHLGRLTANPDCPDIWRHGAITVLPYALLQLSDALTVERLLAYLPVLLAGLLAVPLVLIGGLYGNPFWGFTAALVAVTANSYYNRTMTGYFDTDMFSVTVGTSALCCLLYAQRRSNRTAGLCGALLLFVYPFFHRNGASVALGLGLAFIGYRLAFHYRERFTWQAVPVVALALVLLPSSRGSSIAEHPLLWSMQLALLFVVFALLNRLPPRPPKWARSRWASVGIALTLVLVGAFATRPILSKAGHYLRVDASSPDPRFPTLHMQDSLETASEVMLVSSLSERARLTGRRISGSLWGGLLALSGFVLLVARWREFLIAIPFIGLGLFSLAGGPRFTIYAVPIAALAATFVPWGLQRVFGPGADGTARGRIGSTGRAGARVMDAATALLTVALLVPNYAHARSYLIPPTLDRLAVEVLDAMRQNARPGDFALTWWDYGTAVWYHGDGNVLCHPGSRTQDIYIIAKMLTSRSQALAANLGRFGIEVYARHPPPRGLAVRHLFQRHEPFDPPGVLRAMERGDYPMPVATRDVYLYLPRELLKLYPAIRRFSERDLVTGRLAPAQQYAVFERWSSDPTSIALNDEIVVDRERLTASWNTGLGVDRILTALSTPGDPLRRSEMWDIVTERDRVVGRLLSVGTRGIRLSTLNGSDIEIRRASLRQLRPAFAIRSLEVVDLAADGVRNTREFIGPFDANRESTLRLVLSPHLRIALLMDREPYESNLIQMLVFGRFDPERFEPVTANAAASLYRLLPGPELRGDRSP